MATGPGFLAVGVPDGLAVQEDGEEHGIERCPVLAVIAGSQEARRAPPLVQGDLLGGTLDVIPRQRSAERGFTVIAELAEDAGREAPQPGIGLGLGAEPAGLVVLSHDRFLSGFPPWRWCFRPGPALRGHTIGHIPGS